MIQFIQNKLIKKRRDPRDHLNNMANLLAQQNDQSLNLTPDESVCS